MLEFRQKQRIKGLAYSIPSLIILLLIALFLVKGAWGIFNKERESGKVVRDLEAKAEALNSRESELKEGIASLQTQEGIFQEIKEKFSVTQEGEHVAIIVDERSKKASSTIPKQSWLAGLWQEVLNLWP
ncbi:hypothetical protein KW807_00700 [Candidatus Parcubacteria bacterium]|nr:hypothetical protein [Candidatus Parcubacteria bacterium]